MTDKKPLTDKQKAFARLVAEGSTYSAAYREAYNAENTKNEVIWVKASELMSNGKVLVRVEELRAMAQERTLVTIEKQTERLQALSLKGEGYDTPSGITAAINAEKEVNKLNGLIVDKSDHTSSDGSMTPRAWETMYAKPDGDSDA